MAHSQGIQAWPDHGTVGAELHSSGELAPTPTSTSATLPTSVRGSSGPVDRNALDKSDGMASRQRRPSSTMFLDLPAELRETILWYACVRPGGVGVGCHDASIDGAFPQGIARPARPPLALFLASVQLYHEASAVYYSHNTFHINCSNGRASALLPPVRRLLGVGAASSTQRRLHRPLYCHNRHPSFYPDSDDSDGDLPSYLVEAPPARLRIRSVVLYVRRFGASVASAVVPVLREMVLRGSLRRLEVRVHLGCSIIPNGRSLDPLSSYPHLERNEAFRALLSLVADPDLQVARWWVFRAHSPVWCRFHLWREGEEAPSPERRGFDGQACCPVLWYARKHGQRGGQREKDEGEEGYMELDLPKLVRVCGGDEAEFRIAKVGDEYRRPPMTAS